MRSTSPPKERREVPGAPIDAPLRPAFPQFYGVGLPTYLGGEGFLLRIVLFRPAVARLGAVLQLLGVGTPAADPGDEVQRPENARPDPFLLEHGRWALPAESLLDEQPGQSAPLHASPARRMTKDRRPLLERRVGRLPAVAQAAIQQFVGAGLGRPDGDRRHGPHSGQTECDPSAAPLQLDEEVVFKLVHADDIDGGVAKAASLHPVQHSGDALKFAHFVG